jgi:hypothetical protein
VIHSQNDREGNDDVSIAIIDRSAEGENLEKSFKKIRRHANVFPRTAGPPKRWTWTSCEAF